MNEDYVTYEQAVSLKELGFDWECYHYYNMDRKLWSYTSIGYGDDSRNWNDEVHAAIGNAECSAPTLAQAQKWLREVKGIYLFVTMEDSHYYWYIGKEFQIGSSESYEDALSHGINKTIEHLKEK